MYKIILKIIHIITYTYIHIFFIIMHIKRLIVYYNIEIIKSF